MDTESRLTELESTSAELARRIAAVEARGPSAPANEESRARVELAGALRRQGTIRRPSPGPRPPRPPQAHPAGLAACSTPPPLPRPVPPAPEVTEPTRSVPRAAPADPPGRALEDLLGGRILAWVGGAAVLVGLVLFFALAFSRGWIGYELRCALATAGSLVMLALGVWLHERRGRTEAALLVVGTALTAAFMTLVVSTEVYGVLGLAPGLALALAVGASATALAIRWEARPIGALGIVGALAAPAVLSAPSSLGVLALLFAAGVSAVAVLLWQKWNWLGFAVFFLSAVEWVPWALGRHGSAATLAVLTLFGALGVGAAIGFELRVPSAALRASSAFLLTLNAFVLALAGWFALVGPQSGLLAQAWVWSLAAAHLAVGLLTRRTQRISAEIRLLALTLGVILADVGFGLTAHGPAQSIGWALGGVAFAGLLRRTRRRADQALTGLGLGAHVAFALLNVLVSDVPPAALHGAEGASAGGLLALGALAAACLTSARLAGDGRRGWLMALDALGLALVGYLMAGLLDGPALVLAWTGEAVALAKLARRRGDRVADAAALAFLALAGLHVLSVEAPPASTFGAPVSAGAAPAGLGALVAACFALARLWTSAGEDPAPRLVLDTVGLALLAFAAAVLLGGPVLGAVWAVAALALVELARRTGDPVARHGALAFFGLALAHVLAFDAPPSSLSTGMPDVVAGTLVVALSTGAAASCARLGEPGTDWRRNLSAAAGLSALWLASAVVVSAFVPGGASLAPDAPASSPELGVHQAAQVALSVLWALAGVAGLLIGLRRDVRDLRRGALALLVLAIAKVFLVDLATLDSVYRVGSFLVLGLGLLAGAFGYGRLRPRPLPDLRSVPPGLR